MDESPKKPWWRRKRWRVAGAVLLAWMAAAPVLVGDFAYVAGYHGLPSGTGRRLISGGPSASPVVPGPLAGYQRYVESRLGDGLADGVRAREAARTLSRIAARPPEEKSEAEIRSDAHVVRWVDEERARHASRAPWWYRWAM